MSGFSKFKLLLMVAITVSLSGCVSTKTVKKYVQSALPKNAKELVTQPVNLTDYTLICTDTLHQTDSVFSVKRTKAYFVPAIVFWAWNSTFETDLNKNIFLKALATTFEERGTEFELKKHLEGRKLIVEVERLPASFRYSNGGWGLFLLYSYTYSFGENIQAENQIFRVRYKIIDHDVEIAHDVFERSFSSVLNNNYSATDKFVSQYMNNTTENFKKACEDLFDKIVDSL